MTILNARLNLLVACLVYLLPTLSYAGWAPSPRQKIDLSGKWRFHADPANNGINSNGQQIHFEEEVTLPGSMAENKKGEPLQQHSSHALNPLYKYVGAAWYQKEITIPASWKDKQVQLFLERTKVTRVYVDGNFVGGSSILSAPQVFDLTGILTPGRHTITIMVSNDPKLVRVGSSHAVSDDTQTNWNGIIGQLYLEAANAIMIDKVRIHPDVPNKQVQVQVSIRNQKKTPQRVTIVVQAKSWNSAAAHVVKPLQWTVDLKKDDTVIHVAYPMGNNVQLWSEYHPALYQLILQMRSGKELLDEQTYHFGMRRFVAAGTQFRINDVVTFLRGKNDGCIFPLTGYPAMDTAAWRRLYRIAKSYGINHYRFHSYTPPAAAFLAADVEGIYIQSELPLWANLYATDTITRNYQCEEGKAIFDAYGNHASFVMFTLGNELTGEPAVHNQLVRDLRAYDGNRRLYAYGTNAFYADPRPGDADDFWVTMRTGKESPARECDVRGSFATTEDVSNGIINTYPPSTRRNFAGAIAGIRLPVIGHETGQYQVYPDYRELPLYTGVLKPHNLEMFKKRLFDAGMGDQAAAFFEASGKLSALLYREEIEMAFRTPGLAGFQLLDLQDYPGQGTALVGLLNAFMDSKGLISPETFRTFNNDAVLQLLMDRYTYTNSDTFTAAIQLVNYRPRNIHNKILEWRMVKAGSDAIIASGKLPVQHAACGKINYLGQIVVPLQKVTAAAKLEIRLQVPGAGLQTEYPVWVYPSDIAIKVPSSITVATQLSEAVVQTLTAGGKVLLFPDHQQLMNKTVPPQFISEFWNWRIFKGGAERNKRPVSAGTLGILTDPKHPLFNAFPTEFHTNWQWWSITTQARPLILDSTNRKFRPLVQVIDNIDRNHKLGIIFESAVGKGKLLVCMADLPALQDKPEARQLYYSILQYMTSRAFEPPYKMELSELNKLLSGTAP